MTKALNGRSNTNLFIITALALILGLGGAACGGEVNDDRDPSFPSFGRDSGDRESYDEDRDSSGGGGDDCMDRYCGREIDSCGYGCQELIGCLMECETDACFDRCFQNTTEEAAGQVYDVIVCLEDNCSDEPESHSEPREPEPSPSGASNAEINQCIDGIGHFCGCASAAGDSCSDSEVDNLYNSCLAGYQWQGFDAYVCMGSSVPSSLSGCLSLFDACIPD
jgi:hypothetical protein